MDYISLYTDFLMKHARIERPLRVVCDTSNGAVGTILKSLIDKLNLKHVTLINYEPDPEFPAHGPNPLLPGVQDQIKQRVVKEKADLGAIFDADGDRIFFIDEKGEQLPSYISASLIFKHRQPPYVADELVYQALHHMNLFKAEELFPSQVGFVFVRQKMREVHATSGAEFSGHYCFKDFFYCDSGLFALVTMLSLVSSMKEPLSVAITHLPKHIVKNEDISIKGKNVEETYQRIIDVYAGKGALLERRDGITVTVKDGWINARVSHTEPIIRIYSGASNEPEALRLLGDIKALI